MSVKDRYRREGERPLKKILLGDGAGKYLNFAKNKLQDMYRSGADIQVHNIEVDDASIKIEKLSTLDRITIDAGGYTWVSIGSNGFANSTNHIAATQLAKAGTSKGPWTERPKDPYETPFYDPSTGQYANDFAYGPSKSFDISVFFPVGGRRPIPKQALQSVGDGRFSFELGSYAFGSYTQVLVNAKGGVDPVAQLIGIANGGFDVRFTTSSGRTDGDDIRSILLTVTYKLTPYFVGTDEYLLYEIRFIRTFVDARDSDHGNYIIVDHTMDGYGPNQGNSLNSLPDWILLTPLTIYMSGIFSVSTVPTTITKYDGVSFDGGESWDYHAYPDVHLGPLHPNGLANVTNTSYAAKNSKAALRLSTQVDFYDPALPAYTTLRAVVEEVNVDGSRSLLYQLPLDPDPTTLSIRPGYPAVLLDGNHSPYVPIIYALGRNVYVIQATYYYVLADAVPGDYTVSPAVQPIPEQYTLRSKFTRSYDGGATWDALTDDGFDVEPTNGQFGTFDNYIDRRGRPNGEDLIVGGPLLYPRKPFEENGGEVYRVYNTITARTTTAGFTTPYLNIDSSLYKSTDQCCTWEYVSQITHKRVGYPPYKDTLRFVYGEVLDRSAPMDPIFPWRVDARVSPPDWW